MTKKFKVHASYITYLDATVEAETMEEAIQLAREMDGGDFKDTGLGDWNIDEVFEEAVCE
jgi:hypothetical protein